MGETRTGTKEKILTEALRLFSKRGYDAVSVEQIAEAVGIKAPSLYNHYKGKQHIFDAIFEETERRFQSYTDEITLDLTNPKMAGQQIPGELNEVIDEDRLVNRAKDFFAYSLHDEFVSQFRKMLTIEQFRSAETAELYTRHYVTMIIDYHKELFSGLIDMGVLKRENPETLAMLYDSPIIVLLEICDRQPEKEQECLKKLEAHVRLFHSSFGLIK